MSSISENIMTRHEKARAMNSNPSSDFQVLFVGYLYPASLIDQILEQEIRPVQTQQFGSALLEALHSGFHGHVEVLSVAPLLDFPHSRLLLAPSAKWRIENKITATMIPFLNIVVLKHLTRFVGTLIFVVQWAMQNRNSNRLIILHGVQSCKIWGVLLGQFFAPCTMVPFLTDDLGISLKWESALLRRMRLVDAYLMKLALQKMSGIIAMTPKLAEKLAPGRPALIMPTIQNIKSTSPKDKTGNSDAVSFTIVYTGSLSHNYGINLLLDAFKMANRPNWKLIITGWGELESTVRDFAKSNPRVQYLGFLDSKSMPEVYELADIFVNPKLTSIPIADLAFPSKIVEYLSTGKPVVSTNLPVFDDVFRQHLIIAQSDMPEDLIRCFDEIFSWSDQRRGSWRMQTLKFVNEELSPAIQGARIRSFVDRLRTSDSTK